MTEAELLRTLVDLVPDVVYFQDEEGRYRFANRAAAENVGLTVDEMLGRTDRDVFPPETAEMIRENREAILAAGESRRVEEAIELPSGEERVYEALSVPLDEETSGITGIAGIVRDVTDRRRAEAELARTKEKYEAVFELNPVSLLVMEGASGRVLEVNRAFEELTGYGRQEVLDRPLAELEIFLDPDRVRSLGQRAASEDDVQEDVVRVRRKGGEVRDMLLGCVSLAPEDGVYVIAAGQDVSPFVEAEQMLRRRAFHDALTGLPNRDLLWDRCMHALERADRTGDRPGVLYLDLDGFKRVNDSHGHAAGDEVLCGAAERFSACTRGEDTVARIGGDEFVVLLETAEGPEDVEAGAERLLAALEDPLPIPGGTVRIGASCGGVHVDTSAFPEGMEASIPDRVDEILRVADEQMYAAKAAGGGCFRLASYP